MHCLLLQTLFNMKITDLYNQYTMVMINRASYKTNVASNIVLDYIDNVLLQANCPTFDFIVNTNKV